MINHDLTPLATRLEEAEASRDLTYEVLAAVGYSDPRDWFGERGDSGRGDPVTSLDAALALVGEKLPDAYPLICRNVTSAQAPEVKDWSCELTFPESANRHGFETTAATPALALLAALLKALAQSPEATNAE